MQMGRMLTENNIIENVIKKLSTLGFQLIQKSSTQERGFDIVMRKNNKTIYVEAKGETSSKDTTARYGKPFDSAQIRVHVSEALYKALEVLAIHDSSENVMASMAFPNTANHRRLVENIKRVLVNLKIIVFFVHHNGDVEVFPEGSL